MKVGYEKSPRLVGFRLAVYALSSGIFTAALMVETRAAFGSVVQAGFANFALWTGICGMTGSAIAQVVSRIKVG